MNKELINKYKTEFDHWLAGGKLLANYNFTNIPDYIREPWFEVDSNFWAKSDSSYLYLVIDDEYVEFRIDRIDNDKNYERGNLRWADKSTQAQNTVLLQKNNTTGYRGVYLENGKYRARIMVATVSKSLGTYETAEEAAIAYDKYVITNNLDHTSNGTYTKETEDE